MREAEELFLALKEALEPDFIDTDNGRELGMVLEENFRRGVWSPQEWGLEGQEFKDLRFNFETPASQSMQQSLWEAVVGYIDEPESAFLRDRTLVRTLNIASADAFATYAGNEYLVVVNSSFHDIIYNLVKLGIIGSEPFEGRHESDLTWHRGRSNGRYDTAGRLLRIFLGALRWEGYFECGIRVSPPFEYLHHAAGITELMQATVLAHEAGHIALDHLTSSSRHFHVAGHEIPVVDANHQMEFDADRYAVGVIEKLAKRLVVGTERSVKDVVGEALFCKFLTLDLHEDAYFVKRPNSHPTPMERLANLYDVLPEWTLEIDPQSFDPARAPYIIPMIAVAECSANPNQKGDDFAKFIGDVLSTPYFAIANGYEEHSGFILLQSLDNAQNLLVDSLVKPLATVAEAILGSSPLSLMSSVMAESYRRLVTESFRAQSHKIDDMGEFVDNLISATVGCEIVKSAHPLFVNIRNLCWSADAGTPFYQWIQRFPTIESFDLRMAVTAISFQVVRNGPDSLWVLDGNVRRELAEWTLENLALKGDDRGNL